MTVYATGLGRVTGPPANKTQHRWPCPRCGYRRTVKRADKDRLCGDCRLTDPTWPDLGAAS